MSSSTIVASTTTVKKSHQAVNSPVVVTGLNKFKQQSQSSEPSESETDSSCDGDGDGDDDSQSSNMDKPVILKLPSPIFKKQLKIPLKKLDKASLASFVKQEKSESFIEKLNKSAMDKSSSSFKGGSFMEKELIEEKPVVEVLEKIIQIQQPKIEKRSIQTMKMTSSLSCAIIDLIKSPNSDKNSGSGSSSSTLNASTAGDIYEFKEPEPFEFETSPSASKKSISKPDIKLQTTTSVTSSALGSMKKKKNAPNIEAKPIALPVPVVPIIPVVTAEVKKEEPLDDVKSIISTTSYITGSTLTPSSSYKMLAATSTTDSTFDFLRKSPSYNPKPSPVETSQPKISTDDVKPASIVATKVVGEAIKEESKVEVATLKTTVQTTNATTTVASILVKKEVSPSLLPTPKQKKEDDDDDDDENSKSPLKDEMKGFKELILEIPIEMGQQKTNQYSISDNLFNKINNKQQQQQNPPKIEPSSSDVLVDVKPQPPKISPKVIESIILPSAPIPISLQPASIIAPVAVVDPLKLHELPALIKKDIVPQPKKTILELDPDLISPEKNNLRNNLNETIQKLTSNLDDRGDDDSSDSTDSEHRLVIEDESQGSETTLSIAVPSPVPVVTPARAIEVDTPSSGRTIIMKTPPHFDVCPTREELIMQFMEQQREGRKRQESLVSNQIVIPILNVGPPARARSVEKEDISLNGTTTLQGGDNSQQSQSDSIHSMLLCEETIPGSPAPPCSSSGGGGGGCGSSGNGNTTTTQTILPSASIQPSSSVVQHQKENIEFGKPQAPTFVSNHPTGSDIKPVPMDVDNDIRMKVDNIPTIGTPLSSPHESISPDDSKSESEKREPDSDISPKKRRRPRKTSECANVNKRRKSVHQQRSKTTAPIADGKFNIAIILVFLYFLFILFSFDPQLVLTVKRITLIQL